MDALELVQLLTLRKSLTDMLQKDAEQQFDLLWSM